MTPLSLSHLPPDSPLWLRGLILVALVIHIGAGSIAIISGFAAVAVHKGGRLHRAFGRTFVVSMLTMAAAATFLATRIPQRGNVVAGLVVFYLILSAWGAARRPPGPPGRFEVASFASIAAISALVFAFAVQAARSPGAMLDGVPAGPYFGLAGLTAVFAALDFHMILRGGLSGPQRTARHLGRMCLALFFASGSFFIGQQKVMPAWLQGSPVLLVLGLAPFALMIFWLIRVRILARPRRATLAPAG